MKTLLIFAAVLFVSQAAKVPQLSATDVIHRVTVPVPMNVFAAAPEVLPAVVVEVSKDHVHEPDMPVVVDQPIEEVMITVQPEVDTAIPDEDEFTTVTVPLPDTTTINPIEEEHKVSTVTVPLETEKVVRTARAVAFTDNQRSMKQPKLATDIKVIKSSLTQGKSTWNKMSHRSMRSIVEVNVAVSPNPGSADMAAVEMSTMKVLEMSTINPCDLLCTKFEFDPVCATNGLCLHDFPNQCILDTYNCKHPNNKFSATKDDRCQMHWLTKCEESELI